MTSADALPRRRFLQAGGAAAAAALLAACGGGSAGQGDATGPTTTTEPRATDQDQVVLRTATSLELLLIQVYEQAVAAGVLGEDGTATAELLLSHHQAHARAFQQETLKAGGQPVEAPNRVLSQAIGGRLAFQDEGQVWSLARELEQVAVATYTDAVGSLQTAELNVILLGAAGADGRHLAILGPLVGQPSVAASGFAGTDGALSPGTGL